MEVSKRDINAIILLLTEAAGYYDQEARQTFLVGVNGTRYAERARKMRNIVKKLKKQHNHDHTHHT